MIYTVTLNPALDKTIILDNLMKGSVNRVRSSRIDVGGKGINVSRVLRSLAMESTAVGFLGRENASTILVYLDMMGIHTDFIIVEGETRTNIKIVETDDRVHTDINENGFTIKDSEAESLVEKLLSTAKTGDIVILSGSIPPGADKDIYGRMILSLNEKGVNTILDADGEALKIGIQSKPHAVKPNISELGAIVDIDRNNMGSVVKGATTLLDKGIRKVMVSLDSKGALYLTDTVCLRVHPPKVTVKSTVGAGDAVVAALAYSMQMGLDEHETLKLACACGTASVMTEGTSPPPFELIKELMDKTKIEPFEMR